VRTGELKREVQGRSGGASGTHRNLELELPVTAEDGEKIPQPGGPIRGEEGREERGGCGVLKAAIEGMRARLAGTGSNAGGFQTRERKKKGEVTMSIGGAVLAVREREKASWAGSG
jgi:hypothetical protein